MKKVISVLLFSIIGLFSCVKPDENEPIWLNPSQEISNLDTLRFLISGKDWTSTVYSSIQPFIPDNFINGDTITLIIGEEKKLKNGNLIIALKNKRQNYYYYTQYINRDNSKNKWSELRSPKTLNLDFFFPQQLFLYLVDDHGNLLKNSQGTFFNEELIYHSPKIGTYRGVTNTSLSSFYIVAGSVTDIPIRFNLLPSKAQVEIEVGPLKDKYGNSIADGTNLQFEIIDGKKYSYKDAYVISGYSRVKIHVMPKTTYKVLAHIGLEASKPLKIRIP